MSSGVLAQDTDGGTTQADNVEIGSANSRSGVVVLPTKIKAHGGDALLLRGFPKSFILGLDAGMITAADKSSVAGVRSLSPGPHLLWGASDDMAMRSGIWLIAGSNTGLTPSDHVFITKWSSDENAIVEESDVTETRLRSAEVVEKQWNELIPYLKTAGRNCGFAGSANFANTPLESIWWKLTWAITGKIMIRVTGDENSWMVDSITGVASDPAESFEFGHNVTALDSNASPHMNKPLNFLMGLHDKIFNTNSVGRDRTIQATDSSDYIWKLISSEEGHTTEEMAREIVGELQFAYVTGILIGNHGCQRQWGHMVKTIFKADSLIMKEPAFFAMIVRAVHAQLLFDEHGVEGTIFTHDSSLERDLQKVLSGFKVRLQEKLRAGVKSPTGLNHSQKALGSTFEYFEEFLVKSALGWNLSGDPDEDEVDDGFKCCVLRKAGAILKKKVISVLDKPGNLLNEPIYLLQKGDHVLHKSGHLIKKTGIIAAKVLFAW